MPAKKILLIDDHPLFRESLIQIIKTFPDVEVVGEAGDASEGENMAMGLHPDLAVVDLSLPDKSGIQLTRTLISLLPSIKIVIVSMHTKIDYVLGALRAGAFGYVAKESVGRHLRECLEAVLLNGEYYLDPTLSHGIALKLLEVSDQTNTISDASYGTLSSREQEVLRLVAMGLPTKEVAEKLSISPKTAANHRANLMAKLDLRNAAELVGYAARVGLLGN